MQDDSERRAALLAQISAMPDSEEDDWGEESDSASGDGSSGGDEELPPDVLELLPPLDADGRIAGSDALDTTLRTHRDALRLEDPTLASLRRDCAVVFALDGSNWLQADQAPRCLMEALALAVFDRHTRGVEIDRAACGAEWWAQVRSPGDTNEPIPFHWDVDEYCQDALGISLPPPLSTVTYLSDSGAPTLVLGVHTPRGYRVQTVYGPFGSATLSYPRIGKHLAFDGRLLHGAVPVPDTGGGQPLHDPDLGSDRRRQRRTPVLPSAVPLGAAAGHDAPPPSVSTGPAAPQAVGSRVGVGAARVSFLVNIWLHHQPTNIEPLPETIVPALTPLPAPGSAAAQAVCRFAGAVGMEGPGVGGDAAGGGAISGHPESGKRGGVAPTPFGASDAPVRLNMDSRQGPRRVLLSADFGRGKASHRLRIALPAAPPWGKNGSPSDTVTLLYGAESQSGVDPKSGAGGEQSISGAGVGFVDGVSDWTRLAIICAAEAERTERGAGDEAAAGGQESGAGARAAKGGAATVGGAEAAAAVGDRASKRKR